MKKIRIVYGLGDLLVGGMQRQFVEQMRHIDMERFDISLITFFQLGHRENLYGELNPKVRVHRFNFTGWYSLGEWWRLFVLLRDIKPDIVVSSLFFANTVLRVLKPLVGYVSIPREHNTYLDKTPLQIFVDRTLSHLSHRIVAVATQVADFTARQEHIPRERFVVIRNGIDLARVRGELNRLSDKETLKHELGYAKEDHIALNISRLVKQKNHTLLIDGFLRFQKTHPDYKLAIVGDGGERATIEAHAAKKGNSAVKVFGQTPEVWKFYKASDLFVSAASIEGMSNAELEASAASLPLVSTETSGTDEILSEGENGHFIRALTPAAIADALEKTAGMEAALGKRSFEHIQEFDIPETVRQYEQLFEEAANV